MEKAGGIASNLDTRLLRFRNRPSARDAVELSRALLDSGRSAEALEVAGIGLRSSPDDAGLMLVEGQAWMREGDLIRAQASLLKAARAAPRDAQPFRWLGEVLLKRGDPARALKVLERAAAITPNDPELKMLQSRAGRLARIADTEGFEDKTRAKPKPAPPPSPSVDRNREKNHTRPNQLQGVRPPAAPAVATPLGARKVKATTRGPAPPPRVPMPPPSIPRPAVVQPPKPPPVGPPPEPIEATSPLLGGGPDPFAEDVPTAVYENPDDGAPTGLGPAPLSSPFGSDPFSDSLPTSNQRPGKNDPMPPVPAPPVLPSVAADYPEEMTSPSTPGAITAKTPPEIRAAALAPEPAPADLPPVISAGGGLAGSSLDFGVYDGGPPPMERTEDEFIATGEQYGAAEDVDGVLRMLEREGLFESPTGAPAQWATRKEAQKSQLPVGKALIAVWVLVALLITGGYFGWSYWVDVRHEEAATLVATATDQAKAGNHKDLIDAERNLTLARELNPRNMNAPRLLLFIHTQGALENGTFQPGLRATVSRVEELLNLIDSGDYDLPEGQSKDEVTKSLRASIRAANAVLASAEGNAEEAKSQAAEALEAGPEDPFVLYMVGRVEQGLGEEAAEEHLRAALAGDESIASAAIALAELAAGDDRAEEANELLDQVLTRSESHMRATLWKKFLAADQVDPDEVLLSLGGMAEAIEQDGSATDTLLSALTRARLFRRKGDLDAARGAVEAAAEAGADDPRLLALLAFEANSVGEYGKAQRAATAAVRGSPDNTDFRKLLAEVLIARRDGVGALRTLGSLSMDDPRVLRMSAEAALIVRTEDTLTAASTALQSHIEGQENPSADVQALRIRTMVALGQANDVLRDAQALAEAAPGDPIVSLALGETALAVRNSRIANEALEGLVQASPENAHAHYLLGRARRLGNQADQAEESFRRATELAPEHTEAKLALGRLLLDQGEYQEADELYQALASAAGVASGSSTALLGRLGRVEALLGLGRVDDASVQLDGVRPQDRETTIYRITGATVALRKGQAGDAVTLLRPAATVDSPRADVLALYGDVLLGAGQSDAALRAYDQALEKDGGLPEALLGRAELSIRAESPREARDYLDRVERALSRRIRPPALQARMHLLVGRSYVLEGRDGRDRARRALRDAVAIDGVPPEAHFFLGEALSGENAPEARAAYERYLELAPEGYYASRARRAIR
ncbi:MAG: tetratricopeptide repeat protein [Myxococcota bacterium]